MRSVGREKTGLYGINRDWGWGMGSMGSVHGMGNGFHGISGER